LPEASVAVTVTTFEPRFEQPNVLGDTVKVTPPQLSEAKLTNWLVVTEAEPEEFNTSVVPLVFRLKVGAILSVTVTVMIAVDVLPLASVAVTVTLLLPRSAHVNVVWLYVIAFELEQLSVALAVLTGKFTEPLDPRAKATLAGAVMVGAVASTTVTDFVAVLTLPEASVAVIVTALLPRSEHPNVLGVIVTVGALVQLSEVLLTTSDDVIVAAPLASNVTVTAPEIVVMLGAVLSTTVTVT
jgi:hypothetical protein